MPSPKALELDGKKEIYSRHLGVDLTMYVKDRREKCSHCNKYGESYSIFDLLTMPPLDQRGFGDIKRCVITAADKENNLIADANGNLIPDVPGATVSILELPKTHIAIQYLEQRGFDIPTIASHFDVQYCYRENPRGFYGSIGNYFRTTPQSRIIFNMWINGVRKGWQARIIDYKNEYGVHYYWHPYALEWFPYSYNLDGTSILFPGVTAMKIRKYIIATGTKASEVLMGYDAVVKNGNPTLVVVEGVLDAAKLGPIAVSVQGKTFSDAHANLIACAMKEGQRVFKKVVVIGDNDTAGNNLVKETFIKIGKIGIPIQEAKLPPQYKDLGEMSYYDTKQFITPYL